MSRRDDTITLRQMLDHTEEAVALAKNRTRPTLPSKVFRSIVHVVLVKRAAMTGHRRRTHGPTPSFPNVALRATHPGTTLVSGG